MSEKVGNNFQSPIRQTMKALKSVGIAVLAKVTKLYLVKRLNFSQKMQKLNEPNFPTHEFIHRSKTYS